MHRALNIRSLLPVIALIMLLGSLGIQATELVFVTKHVVTPQGSSIRGLALSPDEKALYVCGMNEKSMAKLDLSSGSYIKTSLADLGSSVAPKAVSVDANGKVWVPLTAPILAVYSPDLQMETLYDLSPFGLVILEGALVSPGGDIYLTNRDNAKPGIFKFRLIDGQLHPVTSFGDNGYTAITELRMPVFLPNGDLIMTSWVAGKISRVDDQTGQTALYIQGNRTFWVDADANGYAWVAHYELKDPALSLYNPDGSLQRTWSMAELGVVSEASSVAVTRDGKRLYLLDQRGVDGGTVLVFDIK
jgi:DNA-binding beta-propeller fold protein YncE